jgi:putative ATP-dependent endonuclease of the OLD family
MKIEKLEIKNFRVFENETILFSDYNCFAGPNGAGKSTVLTALNVFFRETADASTDLVNLDEEDFHQKNTYEPIGITVTFGGLTDEAKSDLADYVRQDKLIVSAVAQWNENSRKAVVKQFGSRLGMGQFAPWFKANNDEAKVAQLQDIYGRIRKDFPDLSASAKSKPAMLEALTKYESSHPEKHELLESEDLWYGVSRGKNKLQKFLQWVFVPAVKDANSEAVEGKKTALGALLERTVREKVSFQKPLEQLRQEAVARYRSMLYENESVLKGLSDSLTDRLHEWAHPDADLVVQWQSDPAKAVSLSDPVAEILAGEGPFKGKLARFGHGLQRSFLLAILQELATMRSSTGPTLVLAIEEPELYQHPPQARHLASVLDRLAAPNQAQVIVCTHSPLFISGRGFEEVQLVRKAPSGKYSKVSSVSLADVAKEIAAVTGEAPLTETGTVMKVHQVLQPSINEMFFASVLILVEGQEDVAYITAYMELLDQTEEFRRLGCHIVPMPTSGKGYLTQPLVIAKKLSIPTFVVFDSDAHNLDKLEKNGNKNKHDNQNCALLRLCGVTNPDPFPKSHFWGKDVVMWWSEIGAVAAADYGKGWSELQDRVRKKYDSVGVEGLNKNSLFIGYTLATAWDEGKRFPSFDKLCNSILEFARASRQDDSAEKLQLATTAAHF